MDYSVPLYALARPKLQAQEFYPKRMLAPHEHAYQDVKSLELIL